MKRPLTDQETLREFSTDPDLIEQAEELAEQFRSSLYENDDLNEKLYDLASGWVTTQFDGDEHVQLANVAIKALHQVLKPMIAKVFAEGDWQSSTSIASTTPSLDLVPAESEQDVELVDPGQITGLESLVKGQTYDVWFGVAVVRAFVARYEGQSHISGELKFSMKPLISGQLGVRIDQIRRMQLTNAPVSRPKIVPDRYG